MSTPLTIMDVRLVLHEIRYKHWKFRVEPLGDGYFLQVAFLALDNDNADAPPTEQRGRKWYVSPHMTLSEVVQTAYLAIHTAEEHEMREHFLYRGERVFGPHFNVNALAQLAADGMTQHRTDPAASRPRVHPHDLPLGLPRE